MDAIELLGGGSRVPRLQAELSKALGGRPLDKYVTLAPRSRSCGGAVHSQGVLDRIACTSHSSWVTRLA